MPRRIVKTKNRLNQDCTDTNKKNPRDPCNPRLRPQIRVHSRHSRKPVLLFSKIGRTSSWENLQNPKQANSPLRRIYKIQNRPILFSVEFTKPKTGPIHIPGEITKPKIGRTFSWDNLQNPKPDNSLLRPNYKTRNRTNSHPRSISETQKSTFSGRCPNYREVKRRFLVSVKETWT